MSDIYSSTIEHIQQTVKNLTGDFAFIANYSYNLDVNQLSGYGRQEMLNSGIAFFERYRDLAEYQSPFVRASGSDRVAESADLFMTGFDLAQEAPTTSMVRRRVVPAKINQDAQTRHQILIIPEGPFSNNTSVSLPLFPTLFDLSPPGFFASTSSNVLPSLSHSLCSVFENRHPVTLPTPLIPILTRLSALLPSANLSLQHISSLMDLCPFNTLSSHSPVTVSPFCTLFSADEWHIYDMEKSREKYNTFGAGAQLGPTQGVGWVNELIARLTNRPVNDSTSTNRTLDGSPRMFPLDRRLYADFSHDNIMTSIFFAMGLFNGSEGELEGFRASETVPFAGRSVVEKMSCRGEEEEMVRVIINDRVMPLHQCGGDTLGRCALSDYIASLAFARGGGRWRACFKTW